MGSLHIWVHTYLSHLSRKSHAALDLEIYEGKEQFCLRDGESFAVAAIKDEVKLKEADDGTIRRTWAPSFFIHWECRVPILET